MLNFFLVAIEKKSTEVIAVNEVKKTNEMDVDA